MNAPRPLGRGETVYIKKWDPHCYMQAPRGGDDDWSVVLLGPTSLDDRFERIEGNRLAEDFEAELADRTTDDVEGTGVDRTFAPIPEVVARQKERDGAPGLIEVDDPVVVERLQVAEHRSGGPLFEDEGDSLSGEEPNRGSDAVRRSPNLARSGERCCRHDVYP